jgi:quercetin dioxygenase-like cupin family protein
MQFQAAPERYGHNGTMALHTFLENIEAEVPVPENGILSRTVFNDDSLKVVAFGFSAGQELSAHTAPMAAILYFVKGEAEVTLAGEKMQARAGSLVHMPPQLPHGIVAKTPLVMLLLMMKQVRGAKAE